MWPLETAVMENKAFLNIVLPEVAVLTRWYSLCPWRSGVEAAGVLAGLSCHLRRRPQPLLPISAFLPRYYRTRYILACPEQSIDVMLFVFYLCSFVFLVLHETLLRPLQQQQITPCCQCSALRPSSSGRVERSL